MSALKKASEAGVVREFLQFMNKSWSAFHAVEECKAQLTAKGFKEIVEREAWDKIVKPGGRYFCEFTTRGVAGAGPNERRDYSLGWVGVTWCGGGVLMFFFKIILRDFPFDA